MVRSFSNHFLHDGSYSLGRNDYFNCMIVVSLVPGRFFMLAIQLLFVLPFSIVYAISIQYAF